MHSSEVVRDFVKRDTDEDVDVNIDEVSDDDKWNPDDERGHGASKSNKTGSSEEAHEIRRRVGGSSRVDCDQDNYEGRNLLHSKQMKRKLEENTLDKLSTWYQDGEKENKVEVGDKFVSRGYNQAEGGQRKIYAAKYPEIDFDGENRKDPDSKFSDRKAIGKDKDYGFGAHGRRTKRRWDEPVTVVKSDTYVENFDIGSGKSLDWMPECASATKISDSLEIESNGIKNLDPDSINDTIMSRGEERKVDTERSYGGKSEALEKNYKGSLTHQNRSNKERHEEHRQKRYHSGQDIADDSERSLIEEDGNRTRDKNRIDMESSNASVIPEKNGRHQCGSDNFEIDYDDRSTVRRKEQVKEGSQDERWTGGVDYSIEQIRERVKFKDSGKREEDKETRDSETYDKIRDWEMPRRGLEWMSERRRKDGNRTEAVKTSSKYGISNENYDVIEIQTKPFDYGGEDSTSIFVRNREVIRQSPTSLAPEINGLAYSRDEMFRDEHGSGQDGEENKDRFMESISAMHDQKSWRDDNDFQSEKSRGQKGVLCDNDTGGQSSRNVSLPPHGNYENSSFNRSNSQGFRGNRSWRVGRGRSTGRDSQQPGTPIQMVGSPFGPLGIPPLRPMQSLTPNMSAAPAPPISARPFPFQPPITWPGARGVEINVLGVQPGLPPAPLGTSTPRFSPNVGNPPNGPFVFNPLGPGRGTSPSISGQYFNAIVPVVSGQLHGKTSEGWVPPRSNRPPGKAPSRGEQNDYSQNFVDTGMRPQNFIRELELTSVVEDYPKLRDLIQRKDEIVSKSASPPMYYKCDLRNHVLSHEFFGTKFDVVLVDPPWEEYVHRAPGVTEHMEYWTFEEIMNLKIEAITDTPSFIFLWVGDGAGLEQGRQCLKKWGFRRCEDICWVKTNKTNATPGLRHDSHTLFQRSKEHCLMGIKGTVRRSTDGHIIHANIDTDVIIAEDPPYGSTAKPEDMYRIIEHFALGRRRLELFGGDHNIRSGWLTVGKELSSSNFNSEAYTKNFVDKDGKTWVGVGGRNPPPEAPHLVLTTPEIESLRPKSPMKNQPQQSSVSISLTNINTGNRWPTPGMSPQNHNTNQDIYSSNVQSAAPWSSSMEMFKGREVGHLASEDKAFDMYGYNPPFATSNGSFLDSESHRGMNMM
ncbi:methyltransferase-like protein 1 [Dorcoceras hygrometricum]|uniref:Methyltransferase-like protein 1 n=1 Tax=Dorcoceras hygrometricum TaxID=472368 RepID=A0A2Z7BYR0_9LAMI|nr:methyltransferase-like protein 1 [Dorcoceras hygrometricum]